MTAILTSLQATGARRRDAQTRSVRPPGVAASNRPFRQINHGSATLDHILKIPDGD